MTAVRCSGAPRLESTAPRCAARRKKGRPWTTELENGTLIRRSYSTGPARSIRAAAAPPGPHCAVRPRAAARRFPPVPPAVCGRGATAARRGLPGEKPLAHRLGCGQLRTMQVDGLDPQNSERHRRRRRAQDRGPRRPQLRVHHRLAHPLIGGSQRGSDRHARYRPARYARSRRATRAMCSSSMSSWSPSDRHLFPLSPGLELLMRGQTPGKRMRRRAARRATADGGAPSVGALLIRNVFRLIDCSAGVLRGRLAHDDGHAESRCASATSRPARYSSTTSATAASCSTSSTAARSSALDSSRRSSCASC